MGTILEISQADQGFRTGFLMKRQRILEQVSLNVPEGSVYGFLGANGAGKTTLIHLIVGLKGPLAGTVRLRGKDTRLPEARARIGYLPERPYFHEHLTGEGLLRYFGALSGLSRSRLADRIPRVLSLVGLGQAGGTELRRYSKGMLQRVGIAQAILHEPEFLVLDEPMSGLDPIGRKEMRELIQRLAGDGHTIFFSSHVIPDVEAICDQVAMIQKGRLIGAGPVAQFLTKGAQATEVILSDLPLERARKVEGLEQARVLPDGVRAVIPEERLVAPALKSLLEAGANVRSLTPIRPSLESFFDAPASRAAGAGKEMDL